MHIVKLKDSSTLGPLFHILSSALPKKLHTHMEVPLSNYVVYCHISSACTHLYMYRAYVGHHEVDDAQAQKLMHAIAFICPVWN